MKKAIYLLFLPALYYFVLITYYVNRYLFTGNALSENQILALFGASMLTAMFSVFLFFSLKD